MTEDQNFTVLENAAIGRNISMYRKIKGLKAFDLAEQLGMKESTYTRYERGEGAITVDMVRKVAEILKIDPLNLLSVHPNTLIENANSPNSVVNLNSSNSSTSEWNTANEEQVKMMLKLMESVLALNEKLVSLLNKKD